MSCLRIFSECFGNTYIIVFESYTTDIGDFRKYEKIRPGKNELYTAGIEMFPKKFL